MVVTAPPGIRIRLINGWVHFYRGDALLLLVTPEEATKILFDLVDALDGA